MLELLEVEGSDVSGKVLDDALAMLLDGIVGHFSRWNIRIDHDRRGLDVRLCTRNPDQNGKAAIDAIKGGDLKASPCKI